MAISQLSAEFYKPSHVEYVYALRCPITFEIFYVGKTQKLSSRFSQHLAEANQNKENVPNKDKVNAIRNILCNGLVPILYVIDFTDIRTDIDSFHSAHKEIYWIQYYLKIGWKLTNKGGVTTWLGSTYYSCYLKTISKERPPAHWYYFGQNEKGEDIYDITRLNNDGWFFIKPTVYHSYNPLNNWRFNSKLGLPDSESIDIIKNTVSITEQPKWTQGFAKSIPPPKYKFEDIEFDDSDFEPEVIENDLSDFEPDDYEEDDECSELYEPKYKRSLYIDSLTIRQSLEEM